MHLAFWLTASMLFGALETLRQHRSADLDAPPWIWTSVVDLVGAGEKAYLDHCRRFALGPERTVPKALASQGRDEYIKHGLFDAAEGSDAAP